jgi:hypothetical protein
MSCQLPRTSLYHYTSNKVGGVQNRVWSYPPAGAAFGHLLRGRRTQWVCATCDVFEGTFQVRRCVNRMADAMPVQLNVETDSLYIELDTQRPIRARNKLYYRFNHWPIWIFVFFIAPGPLTFDLFERGFDGRMAAWLTVVLIGTGIAGLRGRLPGCEPQPYIIRFTEDRPNPLYRRICYTTAWGEVVAFAMLNTAGLVYAAATGEWYLKQMYEVAYFPIAGTMWALGAFGLLPRVKRSTQGEGHERRYFYGAVWAVTIAHPVLWFLWKALPITPTTDVIKLVVFVGILGAVGYASRLGLLPRTRPIVPGEWAVSD